MKLLPMEARHIGRAVEIERLSFPDPWPASFFVSELENPCCLYLAAEDEADGRLMGYAGLQYVLDEGYINNIAVSPEYRRKGVASALLKALFEKAYELKLSFLTLEVRAGNAPAFALYSGFGFEPVGRRKNYYERPREDAILMTRLLTPEKSGSDPANEI
jgi:ribosomal-protein-alanine N-acetyltransferase